MSASPSAERGNVGPCCAHLRVVYRTEDVQMMVEATELSPGGMHTLTHGWWECSDCATHFAPVARLESASEAMQNDMGVLLRTMGISDHARSESPHDVMVNEIIPAVARLASNWTQVARLESAASPPPAPRAAGADMWAIFKNGELLAYYPAKDYERAEADWRILNHGSGKYTLVPLYAGAAPTPEEKPNAEV